MVHLGRQAAERIGTHELSGQDKRHDFIVNKTNRATFRNIGR